MIGTARKTGQPWTLAGKRKLQS